MSLLGAEDWDLYDTADILMAWSSVGSVTIVPGAGRCSTAALHNTTATNGPVTGVNATTSEGYAAFALNPESPGYVNSQFSIGNVNGLNPGDTLGFARILASGAIDMWAGPNTVLGTQIVTTGAGVINFAGYQQIGFEWKFDAAVGYMKIYVNGALVADSGLTNTLNGYSGGQWKTLGFFMLGYMDDLYWGDGSGPTAGTDDNAYMGDLRVEGQVPLSDAAGGGGAYQDWTPSAGTDHGALVNEIPPDGGTTFLESGTPGDTETFKFPPLSVSVGAVKGVIVIPNLTKTEFATREVATAIVSGVTLDVGTAQALASATYRYYPQVYPINPVGSALWTIASVNASEAGVQVIT